MAVRSSYTSDLSELGSMLGTVTSVLTKVLTGGVAVANVLSLVFITPVVGTDKGGASGAAVVGTF